MPDPEFFTRRSSLSLQQICEITSSTLGDGGNPDLVLEDVAPLDVAGSKDLSFLDNIKYKDNFASTKAGACFVSAKLADLAPDGVQLLITEQPYKDYALAAQHFYPEETPESSISEAAVIDPSAQIAEGCRIEAGVVIGAKVQIGAQSWIEANSVIGDSVKIGAHCRVGSNATISHTVMSDYVRVYPGGRIGQDGFGFAIDPAGHVKVPQLGRVIIGSHVEIGANTTIDRGAGPDTVIGQGTWIDNLVQIGHNVRIGRGCVIVAQVGIAGSAVIEDFVAIGGQVGVAGHITVGSGAKIGAQAGVMRSVPAGEEQVGTPAMPIRQFMKQVALLRNMIRK